MALGNPLININQVNEYLTSGIPWVTSSVLTLGNTVEVKFPSVTRTIFIKNNIPSSVLAVAFTQNGLKPTTANYFTVTGTETFQEDLRVSSLFLSSTLGSVTFSVVAGLTRIPAGQLLITGSDGFVGVG